MTMPNVELFKDKLIKRKNSAWCRVLLWQSREYSLKLECIRGNHERKQRLRRHRRDRCSRSWDKWQMARSLEAHRRRDIIQSLYLLVFQRSHSRFNSRYVYCHSVVIFSLKFSLDNKKLRACERSPTRCKKTSCRYATDQSHWINLFYEIERLSTIDFIYN